VRKRKTKKKKGEGTGAAPQQVEAWLKYFGIDPTE
jgi:hypothetical protein